MDGTKRTRTGFMLFALALGTFMSALDSSVVNIAIPVIREHLKVSLGAVEWVVTAYLMVVSSVLLFFGRLSDLYGHKKVYLTGFAVFTLGSLLCGLSAGIAMLISCRVLQALGAAMMFSSNGAIITDNVPAERRGKAFSVVAVAVAVALCTGPVLGGALAGLFGWQSIFYINIPVGIAGLILAAKHIPADEKKASAPLDIPGSLLVFAALFLVLLPLDRLSDGMNLYLFAGMLLAGAALAAAFLLYERRAKHPMLPLELFRNRVFSAGISAAVFNYMAQFIMAFLAPFYLQDIRMFSPAMTGLLYMPMPLTALMAAPLAGYLSDRFDTRYLSSAGMGLMAAGLFMLSFLSGGTAGGYIVAAMVLCGLGSGLFQTPNNTAVMSSAPAGSRGIASGVLSTSRNLGMVTGVALSGALFSLVAGTGIPAGTVGAAMQGAFLRALHITYLAAGGVAVLAMLASLTKGRTRPRPEPEAAAE